VDNYRHGELESLEIFLGSEQLGEGDPQGWGKSIPLRTIYPEQRVRCNSKILSAVKWE